MSQVIDELITTFTLDAKEYKSGGEKVVEFTHKMEEGLKKAGEKAKEFAKTIGEKLKIKEVLAPITSLGNLSGLEDMGKDAVGVSQKFDLLERKIAGVTGSYAKAKEDMELAEKEAGRLGLFKPEELDAAALALERFGVSVKDYLPTVQSLAAVTGKSMDEYSQALGLLANGKGEEALPVLEKAGISQELLKKHGVTFSADNKLTSSPKQAIQGVNAAVQEKFGGVLQDMEGSGTARSARLGIAWEAVMRKIGDAIQRVLAPAIEGLTQGLDKLSESGQLDRIIGGFEKLFDMDPKTFSNGIQKIADILEGVPDKVGKAYSVLKEVVEWLEPKVMFLAKIVGAIWVAEKVMAFGKAAVDAYKAIQLAIKGAATAQVALDAAEIAGDVATGQPWLAAAAIVAGTAAFWGLSQAIGAVTDAMDDLSKASGKSSLDGKPVSAARANVNKIRDELATAIAERAKVGEAIDEGRVPYGDYFQNEVMRKEDEKVNALNAKYKNAIAVAKKEDKDAADAAAAAAAAKKQADDIKKQLEGATSPQIPYLQQISQNTKKSAEELKRYALGGGDLGKMGVVPVEMAGLKGAQSHLNAVGGHIQRNVSAAITGLIQDEINRAMADLMRRGVIRN